MFICAVYKYIHSFIHSFIFRRIVTLWYYIREIDYRLCDVRHKKKGKLSHSISISELPL